MPDTTTNPTDEGLKLFHQSRLSALKKSGSLLAAKLQSLQMRQSTAGSPRAAVAAAKVASCQRLVRALEAAHVQEEHAPKDSANSFILHGRIVDAAGNPLSGYLLRLTSSHTSTEPVLPAVSSDRLGFFDLTIASRRLSDLAKIEHGLFLTVTRPTGRKAKVFAPAEPIHPVAGKTFVFSIVDSSPARSDG